MRSMLTGTVASLFFAVMTLVTPAVGAAPLTAFVEPFKIVGGADAEMSATLQTLLMSRLANQSIQVQDSGKGAQALIKGSYIQLGKVFSVDVTVRDPSGAIVARAFEQGERQEDVLAAMTKVAEKLQGSLLGTAPQDSAAQAQLATPVSPAAKPQAKPDVVRTEAIGKSQSGGTVGQRM